MYLVNGMIKHSELDDYEQGYMGNGSSCHIDYVFKSDTIEDLINQIIEFTGHDDVCLNACDELGRIDIQGMEDRLECAASEREIEAWKKDHIKLWAATYTCYILECKPY